MPAAPIPAHDIHRLDRLRACEVLDTPAEPAFDDLTRLASQLCETPIALISLLDERRQWFKSSIGIPLCQTPRDQAICGYTIINDGPLVVENTLTDRRFFDNPLVTGAPGIRFYAGIPLLSMDGHAYGTLCVIDLKPRGLSSKQFADLRGLARQAEAQLRLRQLSCSLRKMRDDLASAGLAKSMFVATMSHEIRTPLTAITGFLELLIDEESPEMRSDYAQTVRRSVDLLTHIVDDALDFAKIESGRLEVCKKKCHPGRKLLDMERLFAPRARAKGIEFRVLAETPVPDLFQSDPIRVRQVLTNLLSNAMKFTPQGDVALAASWTGGVLTFEVRDSGIGMTPDQLATLFTPFSQCEHDTWQKFGGTGLGLSISKNLADLLGGSLTVRSAPGQGTTFRFELPAPLSDGVKLISDWRRQEHAENPTLVRLDGRRVLVIEDGEDNQRLIRVFLERAGATVQIAGDGRAGVEMALTRAENLDLVLMDSHLPTLDGPSATRLLRDRGFTKPIISISADTKESSVRAAMDAGCNDTLRKPIDRAAFLLCCAKWCDDSVSTPLAAAA